MIRSPVPVLYSLLWTYICLYPSTHLALLLQSFCSVTLLQPTPGVLVTTYPDTPFVIKSYISPTQQRFKLSFTLSHIANILLLSSKDRITWFYNSYGVQHIFCGGPKIYFHDPKNVFCLSLVFGSTCCTTTFNHRYWLKIDWTFFGELVTKMWYYSSTFIADWCLNFTEQPLLQPTPCYNQSRPTYGNYYILW